jgi:hypothetical protein
MGYYLVEKIRVGFLQGINGLMFFSWSDGSWLGEDFC